MCWDLFETTNNLLFEVHKKAIGTIHKQVPELLCEDCFWTQSTSHWTCTLSKDLLADAIRSLAKFSDDFEGAKHAIRLDMKKMQMKHNMEMKALDKGWAVESNFWLSQVGESGELRMKRGPS